MLSRRPLGRGRRIRQLVKRSLVPGANLAVVGHAEGSTERRDVI
jgi:hypothetical protein